VTFRLADSLPRTLLLEVEEEFRMLELAVDHVAQTACLREMQRQRRKRMETLLDRGAGVCWFKDERIAGLACEALRFFEGERYELGEWVVMPNHIHAVVKPVNGWTLSRITQTWKWRIANEANRILGLRGKRFWQPESFDRVLRDEEEMLAVRRYIRRNPVKAGLCGREEDWRWGSAWGGWSG
jgi:REP element-mobilizing transposase RayT